MTKLCKFCNRPKIDPDGKQADAIMTKLILDGIAQHGRKHEGRGDKVEIEEEELYRLFTKQSRDHPLCFMVDGECEKPIIPLPDELLEQMSVKDVHDFNEAFKLLIDHGAVRLDNKEEMIKVLKPELITEIANKLFPGRYRSSEHGKK